MKIIFSPTKEMSLENPVNKDWKLSDYSKTVLDEYIKSDLKKSLKINNSIFEDVKKYVSMFDVKKSYQSINLYNGISFRTLDMNTLSKDDKQYIYDNLLICSALYGPIRPDSLIKPYRLDFNSKLKINDTSLKIRHKVSKTDYLMEIQWL